MLSSVWVFHGNRADFCSAVFTSIQKAESWIEENQFSGVLTEYPLDISVYDWAIKSDFYKPKAGEEKPKNFIQNFSSAQQNHAHYKNGQRF